MAVSRTRKKKKNQNRTTPVWEGRTLYGLGKEAAGAGGPSRSNVAAGHRAAEADRVWFDRHVGASVRVREALPGEHDHRAFGPEPLAPNQKIAVVVVQAAPGRRTRIPFKVVTTPTAGTAISPSALREPARRGGQTWYKAPSTGFTGPPSRIVHPSSMRRRTGTRRRSLSVNQVRTLCTCR
ncbi:hypothetical protein ACH40F_53295 [Streptomyces sp. NPDC020794]|uniref:hypothetical protein n=1 Tax=unclassified Streptomyces TaxID=2593676 RepID=UPI0036F0DD95